MNRVVLSTLAGVWLGWAATSVAQAQTIRLGEINEYKQFPAFLEPYRKGMDLAVEEINRGGGVLGRQIEIV